MIAAFWMGLPPWARTALMWAGAIAVLIATGKFLLAQHDDRVRGEVNNKRDKEAAEVEAEVVTNITENTNEIIADADAVRARDAVVELPDGTKTLPDYHYRD